MNSPRIARIGRAFTLALVLTLLVAPMAGAVLPEKESSPPAEEFPPNVDSAVVEEIRAEGAA
ncbi:MAG TPA: hypothetical protein VJ714_02355, partial [Anaerolineae bacterium]|nr:hypothetical protein [Anaerolineae bacterium]